MDTDTGCRASGKIGADMNTLTVAYVTCRRNPRIKWWLDSLFLQWDKKTPLRLIVVDFHVLTHQEYASMAKPFTDLGVPFIHTAPMPTVWQGPHRLTQRDYWAAANQRNTALCYADDGYIAFCDDLSVLMPGWLDSVLAAQRDGYIACGAYKKVRELRVVDGVPEHYVELAAGIDHRIALVKGDEPVKCQGGWFYGYSASPVEALLSINGYDTRADSIGGEDYLAGWMLQHRGYPLKYCKRMMALESEEAHGEEPSMLRLDKGTSPLDSSHALLHEAELGSTKVAPNLHFPPGGIRVLRESIRAGQPFPIPPGPTAHWFDNQPLSEM